MTSSVAFRLNLLVVLMVTAVLGLFAGWSYSEARDRLLRDDQVARTALKQRLLINLQTPVWNFDLDQLQSSLASELVEPVRGIAVHDMNGRLVASKGIFPEAGGIDRIEFPLLYTQQGVRQEIGRVYVGWSGERLSTSLDSRIRRSAFEIVSLDLALVGILWISLRMLVFRPLDELRSALHRAASHDSREKSIALPENRNDEFGEVAHGFNSIAQRLTQDLEQRRLAQEEIARAYRDLENAQGDLIRSEKLAALGSLVAGVAHELNTPIGNALLVATTLSEKSEGFSKETASGVVRRSQLTDFTKDSLHASTLIVRSLEQAAELVRNFKQVAVDQTSAKRREFDLKEVVEEVLSTLHHLVKSKPIRVRTKLADGVRMDSYPGPLGQVINNFFTNALAHGFAGGEEGEILIESRREGDENVVLFFRDNGCGIAPENLGKIFDPFFTTRLGQGGSGLGLNIVHGIVTQLLGGRIAVESEHGRGTTFAVTLPLRAPSGRDVDALSADYRQRARSASGETHG